MLVGFSGAESNTSLALSGTNRRHSEPPAALRH